MLKNIFPFFFCQWLPYPSTSRPKNCLPHSYEYHFSYDAATSTFLWPYTLLSLMPNIWFSQNPLLHAFFYSELFISQRLTGNNAVSELALFWYYVHVYVLEKLFINLFHSASGLIHSFISNHSQHEPFCSLTCLILLLDSIIHIQPFCNMSHLISGFMHSFISHLTSFIIFIRSRFR